MSTTPKIPDFPELHRDHRAQVTRVVGRILHSCPNDVEDCAQEVWLKVWEKIGTFEGRSALGTWIHTVARNTALMWLRKERQRAHGKFTVSLDEILENVAKEHQAGDRSYQFPAALITRDYHAESTPTRLALDRAIATLPPNQRTIFVMHYVEGRPYDELSRTLGRGKMGVRCAGFRAKWRVRAELEKSRKGVAK